MGKTPYSMTPEELERMDSSSHIGGEWEDLGLVRHDRLHGTDMKRIDKIIGYAQTLVIQLSESTPNIAANETNNTCQEGEV